MAPAQALTTEDGSPIPLAPSITRLPPPPASNQPPSAADIKEHCAPLGVPRVWLAPYPFQVIDQGGVMAFLYESRQTYRLVYMNQPAPDPKVEDPWFFGHSIGRWQGDTLVVDSSGFNTDTQLDDTLPHSDQLKITERFRKIDSGRSLELRVTISDPKVFTRPWTARFTFAGEPRERIAEYVCGIGVLDKPGLD